MILMMMCYKIYLIYGRNEINMKYIDMNDIYGNENELYFMKLNQKKQIIIIMIVFLMKIVNMKL